VSAEIGDDHSADAQVEEIRRGLEAMGKHQEALKDGVDEPSPYEQRQQQVREREAAFHKQAAEKLEEQHDEMRAPIRGEPSSRVLPPEQADIE
jgi:hypothetical protein